MHGIGLHMRYTHLRDNEPATQVTLCDGLAKQFLCHDDSSMKYMLNGSNGNVWLSVVECGGWRGPREEEQGEFTGLIGSGLRFPHCPVLL